MDFFEILFPIDGAKISVFAALVTIITFVLTPIYKLILYFKKPLEKLKSYFRCNVFIAAPMAGISKIPKENKKESNIVKRSVEAFQSLGRKYKCFSHLLHIDDPGKFNDPKMALEENVYKINTCDLFVLIYSHEVLSSILLELGMALGFKKKVLIFKKKGVNLPYLVQKLENVRIEDINVLVIEYERDEQVSEYIIRYSQRLFSNPFVFKDDNSSI